MIDEDPPSARRIVCVTSVPTVTVPKLTDPGVTLSADAVPAPVQSTFIGEPDALLVIVSAPDSAAALVGLNVTVTSVFCPGCKVEGIANPESVTPVPVIDALEIVTAAAPVFDSFTISVDVLPIEIFPKLIAAGVAVNATVAAPEALSATFVGEFSALLLIVSVPFAVPPDDLYVTSSESVPPGFSVAGTVIPPIVNPLPETVTEETVKFAVPLFVSINFCVALVPALALPNVTAAGDTVSETEIDPAAPFPVTPTHPDVISSAAASTAVRNICSQFAARFFIAPGTAAWSWETRLMTTAIVRCAV